jgi:hypothetical protein
MVHHHIDECEARDRLANALAAEQTAVDTFEQELETRVALLELLSFVVDVCVYKADKLDHGNPERPVSC